jgi:hypothetical protein
MSARTIYDTLRAAGLTAEGALGLMGNMMAESMLKSTIAQRGMTNMSDEEYTFAADNGTVDFAHDSVGYGLCQWTYGPRKAELLAACKSRGVSVGDEHAQVLFALIELQRDYPMLLMELRSSHDMYKCTADVCTQFERPAVNNIDARYQYAQQLYNDLCGSGALADEHAAQTAMDSNSVPVSAPANNDAGVRAAIIVMQMVMNYAGYWGAVTGERTPEFFEALRIFAADLEKTK